MNVLSTLWHAPGRTWAGMMRAGSLATWAQIGAGIAFTLFAAGVVVILWRGPWTDAVETQRVDGLVWITLSALFVVLVALVAIAQLRLGINAGKDGLRASVERDDDAPAVVTTTTTTVQPAPSEPTRTS